MLLVDYREGSSDLLEPLQTLGLPAEKGDIAADLAWEGLGEGGEPVMVGVEFKKLGECVQAIRTERLQGHQLVKMRDNFKFNYLLVEGELLYDRQGYLLKRVGRREFKRLPGSMTVSELFKRVAVFYLCEGVNTIWSRSRPDTLKHIEALYRSWTDRALDEHTSHIAIYRAPTIVPISEFRTIVKGIDGIGIKLTKVIEEYFNGSLRALTLASKSELMRIDGIGPKLAEHIIAVSEGRKA